jgi:hypothetical protein
VASSGSHFRFGRRAWSIVALLAVCTLAGGSFAFASSLGVTSSDVTVDTVGTTVPISTCTLTASADTYADQALLISNFGGAATMQVESSQTLALVATNKRGFVRFDLSSCAIPAVANVLSGTLKLFLSGAPSASSTYEVFRTTANWGETTLTWNTQPAVAGAASVLTTTGTTSAVTLSWNVVGDVRSFVSGSVANNGWRVNDQTESSATARTGTFATREAGTAAQRPTLVITYYP